MRNAPEASVLPDVNARLVAANLEAGLGSIPMDIPATGNVVGLGPSGTTDAHPGCGQGSLRRLGRRGGGEPRDTLGHSVEPDCGH